MSIRNCQELGINLQKICSRLLNNNDLIKLLYYVDLDPITQPDLTAEEKQKLFNDLICIIPRVGTREDGRSVIAIYIPKASGLPGNSEFKKVNIVIDIFVPLSQWIIKDSNLRPFAIMGEIQKSLRGKTVNGLGKIDGGDFELFLLTDDISGYRLMFDITEYD